MVWMRRLFKKSMLSECILLKNLYVAEWLGVYKRWAMYIKLVRLQRSCYAHVPTYGNLTHM